MVENRNIQRIEKKQAGEGVMKGKYFYIAQTDHEKEQGKHPCFGPDIGTVEETEQ